jgi:Zn-dependent membrane protease YugP
MMLTVFLCTLAIGLLAHWHVRRTYARHNKVPTLSGYSGAEAAGELLRQADVQDVTILEHEEPLGDQSAPRWPRFSAPRGGPMWRPL